MRATIAIVTILFVSSVVSADDKATPESNFFTHDLLADDPTIPPPCESARRNEINARIGAFEAMEQGKRVKAWTTKALLAAMSSAARAELIKDCTKWRTRAREMVVAFTVVYVACGTRSVVPGVRKDVLELADQRTCAAAQALKEDVFKPRSRSAVRHP